MSSEPIGTIVDLKEMLTEQGIEQIRQSIKLSGLPELMFFKDQEHGNETCVRAQVLEDGTLQGDIYEAPMTEEQTQHAVDMLRNITEEARATEAELPVDSKPDAMSSGNDKGVE